MSINKLTCPFPSNINPLSSGGFMLSIDKAPDVKFWCNQANLPGMTLGSALQSTPFLQVNEPGEILTFDPLSVQFIIDAEMLNYKEIWNWMNSVGFPESWDQFSDFTKNQSIGTKAILPKTVSDGTLSILNNSNVPIKTIQFVDLWPTALGSLQLQANNSDVVYLIGEATFNYSHWKFVD